MFSNLPFAAATLLAALAGVVSAAPLDVYTPHLMTPTKGAVWTVGQTETVTWDNSNPPQNITNPKGTLILAKGGRLDLGNPLASGFNILDGHISLTVPNVTAGDDYYLVLMGDSGNNGPTFSIKCN